MEKRRERTKALTTLLTKIAGLVFMAFLAISVGVIFGTLYYDWVREGPLTPVQSWNEQIQTPLAFEFPESEGVYEEIFSTPEAAVETVTVRYKVQIGPYQAREEALRTAGELEEQGYPVFVSQELPYYVQVGAFANPVNADRLKRELGNKGYRAYIKEE
ncbi:MAG: SPOR domain-containing protein [Firmicutes bacterium]|nr:SPOR domain-containing protein [Bacillota bacterium]